MVHAPPPPIAPRTALWGLGFRFESIGLRFEAIYHDIRDIWLLGKWLSWPFYLIYWYFMQVRDKCWEADDTVVWINSWVRGIVEGSTFVQLLDSLSHHYQSIRQNPVWWITAQIRNIRWELGQLVDDPTLFVTDRLFGRFPNLWQFVYNSGQFILDRIYARYPLLRNLFSQPMVVIISWVKGFWYWIDDLDRDKSGTIIGWISWDTWWFPDFLSNPSQWTNQWLRDSSWELNDLLSNPTQWVKDRISATLGFQEYELIDLPMTILRKIISISIDSQGALMDELENAVCRFILKFV